MSFSLPPSAKTPRVVCFACFFIPHLPHLPMCPVSCRFGQPGRLRSAAEACCAFGDCEALRKARPPTGGSQPSEIGDLIFSFLQTTTNKQTNKQAQMPQNATKWLFLLFVGLKLVYVPFLQVVSPPPRFSARILVGLVIV